MSGFIRLLRSVAVARGDFHAAHAYSLAHYGNSTETLILQRAMSSGAISGSDSGLASLLAVFMPAVAKRSIVARIAAASPFRSVPVATRMLRQTLHAQASWTGQGMAVRASEMEWLLGEQFEALRLSAMTVCTVDMLRALGPAADAALQTDMARAIALAETQSFIVPGQAGIPGVEPASVTHDAPMIEAGGNSAEAIAHDFGALLASFDGDLESSVFVLNSADAIRLATITQSETLTARGGYFRGLAAVASVDVPQGLAVLIDTQGVVLIDEGALPNTASHATVTVETPDGATQPVNLWQQNLTALMVSRLLNWSVQRPGSVACLSGLFAS